MGLFSFIIGGNINEKIKEYEGMPRALLLDVRTSEEYREGHIPNSVNLPLQELHHKAAGVIRDKETPIFAYCHSGARSGQAVSLLKKMGYTKVENLGGIMNYKGKAVK
ncbi:MAG: rhodanese-like domain-containing protein [Lachnospiraceae bacterium]|nr:rhodanese-like domain-containing protein [Lachnospiraceae bacterium]